MKAPASHTERSPRRRVGWSCAAEDVPSPVRTVALVLLLGFAVGSILVVAAKVLMAISERPVIRYSLPLDLFQDSPEVQCGDGKRVLNGHCVCSASCDTLQEAEI